MSNAHMFQPTVILSVMVLFDRFAKQTSVVVGQRHSPFLWVWFQCVQTTIHVHYTYINKGPDRISPTGFMLDAPSQVQWSKSILDDPLRRRSKAQVCTWSKAIKEGGLVEQLFDVSRKFLPEIFSPGHILSTVRGFLVAICPRRIERRWEKTELAHRITYIHTNHTTYTYWTCRQLPRSEKYYKTHWTATHQQSKQTCRKPGLGPQGLAKPSETRTPWGNLTYMHVIIHSLYKDPRILPSKV